MAKFLITGGHGMIGVTIARKILEMGHSVTIIDLKDDKFGVLDGFKYVFKRGTILDSFMLYNCMEDCDYVLHLAALMGVKKTDENPLLCLNINIQGTLNVLDCCMKTRIKRILLTSSSEVYGEPRQTPIQEDFPKSPVSIYGVSKLAAEEYVKAYAALGKFDYTIVRYFNVYGSIQDEEFVMTKFIKSLKRSNIIPVYGNGEAVRSFCHVEDASEGSIKAVLSEKGENEVFNIGNDSEPIAMKALAEKIIMLSNNKGKIKMVPYTESDREEEREIINRIPSIEKARKYLGYSPKVSLDEGIKDMMESLIDNL